MLDVCPLTTNTIKNHLTKKIVKLFQEILVFSLISPFLPKNLTNGIQNMFYHFFNSFTSYVIILSYLSSFWRQGQFCPFVALPLSLSKNKNFVARLKNKTFLICSILRKYYSNKLYTVHMKIFLKWSANK